MHFLATLGTEIANVLFFLLPVFCYLAGGFLGVAACLAIYNGGRDPRNGLAHYGKAGLALLVASLLISIDQVANITSATLGGDAVVGIGGGLLAYSDPSLSGSSSPGAAFLAVVKIFVPALQALGMLSLVCAVMTLREAGRASNHPLRRAAVRAAAAVVLLNSKTIATSLLSGGA